MSSKSLTVGMVGENVAALQQALSALGLSIPDEETKRRFFGPATREAVRKFQERHGLKVTGEIDASTTSHLDTARSGLSVATAIAPAALSPVAGGAAPPLSEFERPLRAAELHLAGADASAGLDAAAARERLDQLKRVAQFEPASGGPASLGDILDTIPPALRPSEEEKLRFAGLYAAHGNSDALWQAAEGSELRAKLPAFKRTLALQQLTGSHAPMMEALHERNDNRDSASLSYLASVTSREWLDLAFEHGAPGGLGMSPAEYSAHLERSIEIEYPTDVLRERLQSGTVRVNNFPSAAVGNFLAAHRDFDLRGHDVDVYLSGAAIDSPELRNGLKQLKRVLPLTGSIDATVKLVDEGWTSQYKIAKAGFDLLRAQLSDRLDESTIRDIHNAARASSDTSLALSTVFFSPFSNAASAVFPTPGPGVEGSLGATLRKLFGDIEYCECRHCQSVLGPAAYFTDLLHFMETSPSYLGGSVLDAMRSRRPDLLDLELTCENTNTEIPYFDLALEILENAVALPLAIPLADGAGPSIENELNSRSLPGGIETLPDAIQTALRETAIMIGASLTTQRVPDPAIPAPPRQSEWIISDGSRRWRVFYQPKRLLAWRAPSGKSNRSTPISLPSFSALSDIETALQAGSLHPDLLNFFAPDPFPPVEGTPQVTAAATTPSGAPGWKVSIRQEIQVEFVPGGRTGDGFEFDKYLIYIHGLIARRLIFGVDQMALVDSWLKGEVTGTDADAAMDLLKLPRQLRYINFTNADTGRYIVQVNTNVILAIASESMSLTALTYQNSSIRTNLSAVPENRNPEAYRKLREARFPWTLPLDLWTEEIRALLSELGVPRRLLIEIARPLKLISDLYVTESLGLSAGEFRLIAQPGDTEPWITWGLKELDSIQDTLGGVIRVGRWLDHVLKHVSMVMQQSRLSYRELLELLQTSFGGAARPEIEPKEKCHPSELEFSTLDPKHLDWIHRFTRLRRRLGWSARELDCALTVSGDRIDVNSMRVLSLMQRLIERLRSTPISLCAMLGHIETRAWTRYTEDGSPSDVSLYERQFQPPTLRSIASYAFFTLNDAGKLNYLDRNPPPAVEPLSSHVEFVASCLGIKPAELGMLLAAAESLDISDEVQLSNLGMLYGLIQYGRALGLSVDEFLRWQKVLDRYPFKRPTLVGPFGIPIRVNIPLKRSEALLDFADGLDFAKRSGRSLEELEYLLRHEAPLEAFEKTRARLLQGLSGIRSSLQSGEVLGNAGYDNLLNQLERAGAPPTLIAGLRDDNALAEILKAEVVVSPIPQPQPVIPENLRGRFYFIPGTNGQSARFGCRGAVSDDDFTDLENVGAGQSPVPSMQRAELKSEYNLARDLLSSQLQQQNGRTLLPSDIARDLIMTARSDDLILRALRSIAPILEQNLLAAQVASFTGLDQGVSAALLKSVKVTVDGASRSAQDVLFDDVMLDPDASPSIDELRFSAHLEVLTRLDKAALLLANSGITVERLDWLTGGLFDVIDINELPAAAGQPASNFADWRAWFELLTVVRAIPDGLLTIDSLAAALKAGAADPADVFVRAYHLPEDQVLEAYRDLIEMAWPGDFRKPARLLQLATLLNLLRKLGASPAVIKKLVADEPDEPGAIAARSLFVAQFDVDTAPQRLELVSNKLRPRQRDALVDYLRAAYSLAVTTGDASPRQPLADANDLLDYFLIDVQMESCMRTSRIKQAISSAQLFIQRCLLNLERWQVAPTDINTRRWEWMKNYRVWEANRKIFLHAENWIEPDLRDYKSEPFRSLESELLQEDLTHETALTAFRRYLESAADLARPVIVSLWEETVDTGDPMMTQRRTHIVARDRSTPYKYFCRAVTITIRQPNANPMLVWSPWEIVEGDFASSHVLVCALDGAPYIVCPSIQADDEGNLKIHLQSRKRGHDGWRTQKQSIDFVTHGIVPGKDVSQSFVFIPTPTARTIRIDCFGAIVKPSEVLKILYKDPVVNVAQAYKLLNDLGHTLWHFNEFREQGKFFYTQIADKIALRVIEKYHFKGQELHGVAFGRSLTVTAVIECDWYDSSDDELLNYKINEVLKDEVIRDASDSRLRQAKDWLSTEDNVLPTLKVSRNFNPPGSEIKQANGDPYITDINGDPYIIGHVYVSDPVKLLEFFPVRATVEELQLHISPNIKCVPKRVISITLSTEATYKHTKMFYKSGPFPLEKDGEQFGRGSIIADLEIVLDEGLPDTANPDRRLDFSHISSFEFDEARALIRSSTSDARAIPSLLNGCEYYCSSYRSLSTSAPLVLNGQTVITSGISDHFHFAPIHGRSTVNEPIGAYSDSALALYFLPVGDMYRALPEGQSWIRSGLRALSGQKQGSTDLEALPVSIIGSSAPPIPYGQNIGWIDWQNSPQTLDFAFDQQLPANLYDWEVFFHIPLLIATQLSQGQRFDMARIWFHTIFDPTSNAAGDEAIRYWRFPPFRKAAKGEQEIDALLEAYARGDLPANERDELDANIEAWKDNPFNPHLIARFRKRSYMWAVVIKYIQNLLAWGDQLFRRDTIESINEATQLYVLAARILGPRPASSPKSKPRALSYRDLAGSLDDFSNKWIKLEDALVTHGGGLVLISGGNGGVTLNRPGSNKYMAYMDSGSPYNTTTASATEPVRSIGSLYFCIPQNESILALWDTVEDRLFKIRHCMNIDGVERRLPLFEPPINPALLVRAAAAGIDLANVLNDFGAPLPLHRFSTMLQKALEVSGDLRSLGGAVLSALEKKDAEELALLRSSHEMALLSLTEQVRLQQIEEARSATENLQESRKTAGERYRHYQNLLGASDIKIPKPGDVISLASIPTALAKSGLDAKEQGLGISQTEQDQLRRLAEAQNLTLTGGIMNAAAGVAFGVGLYPLTATVAQSIGHSLNATASALNAAAGYSSASAGRDQIIGGYERRRDEWIFQSNMALRELAQIDKQIVASQIREAIATQELANTRRQIDNSQEVDAYLRSKYSSHELYRFMSNQLMSIYFRTYQIAFDLAKRAERCFRFELGLPNATFLKSGYWDSARKGVLAGEQLHLDLRRMDLAYLESHKREYEITKHVSLMQIDPLALIALRQTGACEFDILEAFYDLDCPGHYMRRIKSVSITIPCVAGPYAGVHCTLTLLWSSVRKDAGGEDYKKSGDDPRFIDDYSSVQSIVTSGAQADTGLFETNLREERYLPFEGAGAISRWRLELPSEIRQFDYDTISDVILHVRYTARDGGARLKQSVASHARGFIAEVAPVRLFSVRHEFPNEWAKFKSGQDLVIEIKQEHYPFWTRGTGAKTARGPSLIQGAASVRLLASSSSGAQASEICVTAKDTNNTMWEAKLLRQESMAGLLMGTFLKPKRKSPSAPPCSELDPKSAPPEPIGTWNLQFNNSAIDDLWIAVDWSVPAHP